MSNNNRPEIGTVSKRVCPECRRLLSGTTVDYLHMAEDHDYENPERTDGDDVTWKQEKFMSVPDLLDWINENHGECECMSDLVEILEYSLCTKN